ncbi:hypothetical protein DSM104299_05064 [Baekduia alba]|nr:hypothetical protein DSM104299_05064 [Baekduia alba]
MSPLSSLGLASGSPLSSPRTIVLPDARRAAAAELARRVAAVRVASTRLAVPTTGAAPARRG